VVRPFECVRHQYCLNGTVHQHIISNIILQGRRDACRRTHKNITMGKVKKEKKRARSDVTRGRAIKQRERRNRFAKMPIYEVEAPQ